MKQLRRWDYAVHSYLPYPVPDNWVVAMYSDNMDVIINCASCGRKITFGESYTSREIHNFMGFGYAVCPSCHEEEIRRALEHGKA